ncbi:MAG: hypothetical protein JW891_11010 [Candidatus Lokiarchaeota archaeon]|nr:hypothetical protein [Candidatus Lokiarchaeota archaeon]
MQNKKKSEISYDSRSALKIRNELLRNLTKEIIFVILIMVFYIVFSAIIVQLKYTLTHSPFLDTNPPPILSSNRKWSVFLIFMFAFIGIIKYLYQKLTPSLVNFIIYEIKNLGFNVKKNTGGKYLFVLTIIIFSLLDMPDFELYNSYKILFSRLYLILSLFFLLLWGLNDDKLKVTLKGKYYIKFDFDFKLLKEKNSEEQSIRIYMTSNKLCWKSDKNGKRLYEEISRSKWFPRKGKNKSILSKINPFLYFREYSEPINFQNQFLALTLALKDWDDKYKNNL